ncbi:MAG: hypothetical protein JWQ90_4240 [Hydrocarboniphaga sp.]|uniref:DUF3299 domain-containing protein n=1 Tax=Hydrocarboniphaga sp. TaxID=2033016 RepID=UPI0026162D4F|nr:DUF3299 domain-containing protein [Hydrocarboniphaga sp.]MDB5971790.1 hypothetical protein [Hydrocarboniphaga sp.]
MPSPAGRPFADSLSQSSPALAAKKKPSVRYKNGKLVSDDSAPIIEVVSEFDNHRDGRIAVPAYPGDILYLGVNVQTEAGTPLKRKPVEISSARKTRIVQMSDQTDDEGYLEFHMVAGIAGSDMVTVNAAAVSTIFYIDVTEPPRGEWLAGIDLKGVTPWDVLMSAQLDIGMQAVSATFPKPLQDLQKHRLKLVGFMLPLGVEEKQKHFLLSSNPPSCFFHPPGGPSSVVEVFSDKGVAMSYDPMVIEGEFELVPKSDTGILYKLKSTKLIAGGG